MVHKIVMSSPSFFSKENAPLVFTSTMSILVNGSPTLDFQVWRGRRQRDPLSPFLFLMIVEGSVGFKNNVTTLGDSQGFQFKECIHFELIQFSNDSVIISEWSWNILWIIKSNLKDFDLASGLRINLFKSKLYDINFKKEFKQVVDMFLSRGIGLIHFTFFGISVGENPRRKATWILEFSSFREDCYGVKGGNYLREDGED